MTEHKAARGGAKLTLVPAPQRADNEPLGQHPSFWQIVCSLPSTHENDPHTPHWVDADDHARTCPECRAIYCLIRITLGQPPQRPPPPAVALSSAGVAVLGEEIVVKRLSPSDAEDPRWMDWFMRLHSMEWDARYLPQVPPMPERIQQELVYVAWARTREGLVPIGALFGLPSAERAPSFDALQRGRTWWGTRVPRTVNFYEVVVDREHRRLRVGLTMLKKAYEDIRRLYGARTVARTISPIPGLRLFLARLVGAPIDLGSLYGWQRDAVAHMRHVQHGPALRAILGQLQHLDEIERAFGKDLRSFLRAVAMRPDWLWRAWQTAPPPLRAALEEMVKAFARAYAEHLAVWFTDRKAGLLCWVSYFHLSQGARVDDYVPFARGTDPESLFTTVSFWYEAEDKRLAREQDFRKQQAALGEAHAREPWNASLLAEPFAPGARRSIRARG